MVKKGQVSTEFLIIVGVILVIFTVMLLFSLGRRTDVRETETYLGANSECLKFSNLISAAYVGGDGIEIKTKTKYLISFFNYSMIRIESVSNITTVKNRIAFLASEAGPTKQDFYNQINAEFSPAPDWYKTCFSDLDGKGCSWSGTSWMETAIPKNISDLMNDLDKYNTIYLEDSHMQYTTDYVNRLKEWVSKGNALVLSEHVMCREGTGSYPPTSYMCNPPGYNNDNWNIFNVILHQRADAHGWPDCWNVNVTQEHESFNLNIGETLTFEERSWLKNVTAQDFTVIGKYRIGSFKCGRSWGDLGDSAAQPAIAFWKYGDGMIFYFGDFEVNMLGKDFASDVLSKLIQTAYYLIASKKEEASCTFYAKIFPHYKLTGDILIKNIDGEIIIENVTAS